MYPSRNGMTLPKRKFRASVPRSIMSNCAFKTTEDRVFKSKHKKAAFQSLSFVL
jgi:hypothetical protein